MLQDCSLYDDSASISLFVKGKLLPIKTPGFPIIIWDGCDIWDEINLEKNDSIILFKLKLNERFS